MILTCTKCGTEYAANLGPCFKCAGEINEHYPSDAEARFASLARDSAKMTDELLGAAINAVIGEGWAMIDLKGRLQSVRVRDEPQETILLDGKPLVELWPVELETVNQEGKITFKATRRYRTFRPQNAKCGATK